MTKNLIYFKETVSSVENRKLTQRALTSIETNGPLIWKIIPILPIVAVIFTKIVYPEFFNKSDEVFRCKSYGYLISSGYVYHKIKFFAGNKIRIFAKIQMSSQTKKIYRYCCFTIHQRSYTYWSFGGVYVPADIYARYLRLRKKM